MKTQMNDMFFGRAQFALRGTRLLVAAVFLGTWIAGIARADNTGPCALAKVQGPCGGGCISAEVSVRFFSVPTSCMPDCTVTPLIKSSGLCAALSSVMLHIADPGDACADNDSAPFPIDLQAGSFVLTNAQWAGMFTDQYVVRAQMAASSVCDNTDDPPGSGIRKVCTTAADCDAGGNCVPMGKPWEQALKCVQPPIPTLSEWGVVVMTILLLSAGTIVFRRHGALAV